MTSPLLTAKFIYHIAGLIINSLLNLKLTEKKGFSVVREFELKFEGKLGARAAKKAAKFQSVQQIFINDAFSSLIGRRTNDYERYSNKLYFIAAGLYDDIIDQKSMSEQTLSELFEHPEMAKPTNFNAIVLIDALARLSERVKYPKAYQQAFLGIRKAQKDSLKQFDKTIVEETILDITLRKGGYSLLMCRHYIDLPPATELDDCWYLLGGVIQMTNDLYDIHKDLCEGIYTFANTTKDYQTTLENFNKRVSAFKISIEKLPFSKGQKDTLLIRLSVIPAFGYIALENLKRIQGDKRQLPPLMGLERKELIIDMEQFSNMIKLIRYTYKTASMKSSPALF